MKSKISILVIALALLMPMNVSATIYRSGGMKWASSMDGRGLYGRGFGQSKHTISLVIAPNYYSGDVELPGSLLTGFKDHAKTNLYTAGPNNGFSNSVGFGGALQYTYRATPVVAYRAQVMGGYMHGYCNFTRPHTNSAGVQSTSVFEREFSSVFVEYSFGVEIYPIPVAGWFLYAGVSGTTSFITRSFNPYLSNPDISLNKDKVTCTVPMIPVGMGYKWNIKSVQIGIELIWHPALVDLKGMNLDGWESGFTSKGITRYPTESSTNRWTDSFTELGISIGYRLPMR